MFNVVIVEDEKPILDLMKYVIGHNPHYTILGAFSNPLEALDCFPELGPDVVFLDVEMPKMNGLELAQRMNEMSDHTQIIFTTAYKNYALEAFNVQAFDYILKPVTKMAIERVTERLMKQQRLVTSLEQRVRQASIRCFGGFEVRNRDGIPVHWPTRKTEELFAYFLCHSGIEISKWYLADLLWPDMDEERASHNLHNTMYRLKKLLKEQEIAIDVKKVNEGYMLDASDLTYDVLAFERYLRILPEGGGDAAQEEYLVSLYKGSLFDRKDYLWKVSLEKGFSNHYKMLISSLIQQDLVNEDWKKAELRLDQYLSIYPLDEEMNFSLFKLYEYSGRQEQIKKLYTKFENAYRLDMGLEPSQQMRNWVEVYLG